VGTPQESRLSRGCPGYQLDVKRRADKESLQRLAIVAAAAVEAEELLRVEINIQSNVRAEADRRIQLFHSIWNESKR
jgi:hypothetical protein